MTRHLPSTTRRSLSLVVALLAALAMLSAIAPRAEAAKPQQIVGAEILAMNLLSCEVTIDAHLNTRGSMKNDIEIRVTGQGSGFTVVRDARRGATVRVRGALGAPGLYSGTVVSRNPRTGEVAQTVNLGFFTC